MRLNQLVVVVGILFLSGCGRSAADAVSDMDTGVVDVADGTGDQELGPDRGDLMERRGSDLSDADGVQYPEIDADNGTDWHFPDADGTDESRDLQRELDVDWNEAHETWPPDICVPACQNMECGPDGCEGVCGLCAEHHVCEAGACVYVPWCGDGSCDVEEDCQSCETDCLCGCGSTCEEGVCIFHGCDGKECGEDGCGGSCGTCIGTHMQCVEGACVCFPDCEDRECGEDGCGGNCGQCVNPYLACSKDGQCDDLCVVACEDRECGYHPCGMLCGECPAGLTCTNMGRCVGHCQTICQHAECGLDGCWGSCGQCPTGTWCTGGTCTEACLKDCAGKECGPDGCGGTCGECAQYVPCTPASTCGGPCSTCPVADNCTDIDFSEQSLVWWLHKDARIVSDFYGVTPLTGNAMLLLAPQQGSAASWASLSLCLPLGNYVASVTWRLTSKDLGFQCERHDQVWESRTDLVILPAQGQYTSAIGVMRWATSRDLCPADACFGCGDKYTGFRPFAAEYGTQTTPWVETLLPVGVGEYWLAHGFSVLVGIVTSYWPSFSEALLVDRIRIVPEAEFCEDRECGQSPWGMICGQCPAGYRCAPGGICELECIPECDGKECAVDGCGGVCGVCPPNTECNEDGQCEQTCVPGCGDKNCGWDDCGNSCGGSCYGCGNVCLDGYCLFVPCYGKECGWDGCGGHCGSCPQGQSCFGYLCCTPDCEGKTCGMDGCGGVCGVCPPGGACVAGECLPMSCGDLQCGDNGHGAYCGTCQSDWSTGKPIPCINGACVTHYGKSNCAPGSLRFPSGCCPYLDNCAGKECGDSGCGYPCGQCGCGSTCVGGQCVFTACEGKECGLDNCGGTCGGCATGQVCIGTQCCTPACANRNCGDDGCGGVCGLCHDGDPCTLDQCVEGVCRYSPVCCSHDSDCDDGRACTTSTCDGGTCVHLTASAPGCCETVLWSEDFEAGIPDSAINSSEAPYSRWMLTTGDSFSDSPCIRYTTTLHSNGTDHPATIRFPPVCIPAAAWRPKLKLNVKSRSYLSTGTLSIIITVGEAEHVIQEITSPMEEWTALEYDLSPFKGQSIRIRLQGRRTSSQSSSQSLFWVDDIRVTRSCCDTDSDCDDGNICTVDSCSGGAGYCSWWELDGCCRDSTDCADEDECTLDLCTEDRVCVYLPFCCSDHSDCDDGGAGCNQGLCASGSCQYQPTWVEGCCEAPLFWDDFSTDKGWTYDDQWERGPAVQAPCAFPFFRDPPVDHTASADNFLAGAAIGGCIHSVSSPMSYLTSPEISAGEASNLWLVYWRWLSSEGNDVMDNTVEVFDGQSWVVLWSHDSIAWILDDAWTPMVHDMSAYATDQLRIRFGYSGLNASFALITNSWSLDDVRVVDSLERMCCLYDSDCGVVGAPCILGVCAE